MEVGVVRRLSWEGGRGDMQGVCAEGVCRRACIRGGVSEKVGRKEKEKEKEAGTSFEI